MNRKTRIALNGSIRKWERILFSTRAVDRGEDNCPLCLLFFQRKRILGPLCEDCPVHIATGETACEQTPYKDWLRHQELQHDDVGHRIPGCSDCIKYALAELEFLRGLKEKHT